MLEVRDLNSYYRGGLHVLFDISFRVEKGEIVAVLGPNGAGKTTLLKSIMNIEVLKTGSIFFKNRDITRLRPFEIARLGVHYVPDYAGLFPGVTVLENLQLAVGSKAVDLDRLRSLYPGLSALLDRRADALSGGERKIVAILRAIALRPDLLLLDEPTEGLAPVMVDRIIDLVKKAGEDWGLTVVWVEPGAKLRKLLSVVDRILVLNAGRLVYSGTSEEVERDLDTVKRLLFV